MIRVVSHQQEPRDGMWGDMNICALTAALTTAAATLMATPTPVLPKGACSSCGYPGMAHVGTGFSPASGLSSLVLFFTLSCSEGEGTFVRPRLLRGCYVAAA